VVKFAGFANYKRVIDAEADDLVVLAVNKLEDAIVGSSAIVGREMFIRSESFLYCIAE
jgi:hypothetical protein